MPRALGESEKTMFAVVRGVIVATPIVGVFWALLASADDVFAEVADPSLIPFVRGAIFVVVLPVLLLGMRVASVGRPLAPLVRKTPVGTLESTIVLSAVAALFTAFVGLRIAGIGRELSDAALRTEVRSGFFQLLWVALLTVLLVLAVQMIVGSPTLEPRLRRIALFTVGLAAVIDGLALVRIAEYVNTSFLSPLRFWSFGAGLWLLIVLGLAAVRVVGIRANQRWFTIAIVVSWMVFVFAMGVANPDRRIAEHNFANPPTDADEWIAVRPIQWLSEDATPTIVENIEVLRPMPDDR